jgi:hypothetical protein
LGLFFRGDYCQRYGPSPMHADPRSRYAKGHVRRLTIRSTAGTKSDAVEEFLTFDDAGRLTGRSFSSSYATGVPPADERACAVMIRSDGSAIEEEIVAGGDAWACRFIPNVSFGCTGSISARTKIQSSGVPNVTTFYGADGRVVSSIEYASDEDGRVRIARQTLLLSGDGQSGQALQTELCEVRIAYDECGRFARQSVLMLGEEVVEYLWEYFKEGTEVLVSRTLNGKSIGPERHKYGGLDEHGNWTTHTVELPGHSVEENRRIEYGE